MGRNRIDAFITHSAEETIALGESLGQHAQANTIFCLFGNLSAGKTTLIKGIARGAADIATHLVRSPTFVYLNIYENAGKAIYHFDLYRLSNHNQFIAAGFEEFLKAGGITCIEWSERINEILPENITRIDIDHQLHSRLIRIQMLGS